MLIRTAHIRKIDLSPYTETSERVAPSKYTKRGILFPRSVPHTNSTTTFTPQSNN